MAHFSLFFEIRRFGMSYYEEFLWKYFFRKVHIILNIFHIYDFFLKSLLRDLQAIEVGWKIVFFYLNQYKNCTVRVSGINSRWFFWKTIRASLLSRFFKLDASSDNQPLNLGRLCKCMRPTSENLMLEYQNPHCDLGVPKTNQT